MNNNMNFQNGNNNQNPTQLPQIPKDDLEERF